MASRKRSISNDADIHALYKEWDEASCPICMDHPHNAVLLLCSSHDKGCRSYVCDTSYRHSNCLDRFRKLRTDDMKLSPPSLLPTNQYSSINTSDRNLGWMSTNDLAHVHGSHSLNDSNTMASVRLPGGSGGDSRIYDAGRPSEVQEAFSRTRDRQSLREIIEPEENNAENSSETGSSLRCPLCRGSVWGWQVVEEARKYLNLKPRSCSRESCPFFGNYRELRRHARRVHPTARPADVDPSRQRAWRRLENQREYGDIVSAIRSAMPGAIVLGDYVIENGDRQSGEGERGSSEGDGPWLSTFVLFQMLGSIDPIAGSRGGRSRAFPRHRRPSGAFSRRRFLLGENLLRLPDDDDEEAEEEEEEENNSGLNVSSDMGEDASPNPRRRRRLARLMSDEDQS